MKILNHMALILKEGSMIIVVQLNNLSKDLHDIPSSVIIQLARILHTSPNYLLLGEVKEEGWMEEMYELMENIKSPEMRRLALKQLRCVAEV